MNDNAKLQPAATKAVSVFVAAGGNAFMRDIADWLAEGAAQCGRSVDVVTDSLPSDPGRVNLVVAPHEFFVLHGADDLAVNVAASMSVPVMTEQPGTAWFQVGLSYCRVAPLTLDINPLGVAAIERARLAVRRLKLGAVPSMVARERPRDIDVLFLGGDTARRQRMLATLGPLLADARAQLSLFDTRTPVGRDTPGLVFGREKFELLAGTRILVNIHRDGAKPGYFEWARMVEAMANGATVVTEPCAGYEPLVEGTHFVATDELATTVAELLADPVRCAEIGAAARDGVVDKHPLERSLGPILDDIDRIDVDAMSRRRSQGFRRNRIARTLNNAALPPFSPAADDRARVYLAILAEQRLRREIDALQCTLEHGQPGEIIEFTTAAYEESVAASDAPEVSVVVTLFNYGELIIETLGSIVASRDTAFEIVIVDDHSSDEGRAVVRSFMDAHPDVPILLLGREDNHGLAAARDLAVERSRATKVMVMDADNLVYPACLRRLADALDSDPAAAFAYATLEAFGVDTGLRSHLPWNPAWLCAANYIDAQAMVRRTTYDQHGGYRDDDPWVYGWEDWDLWLRLAAAGEHGVHVPQMLGRYRTQAISMITTTNLAGDLMRARVEARYPTLPWHTPAQTR